MSLLILTIGLPGSGKSTWAKEYMEKHGGTNKVFHIELDMLREQMGIDPTFPDKSLMKKALLLRDEQVLKALKEDKVVICSDTNLSSKAINRLKSIASQAKAEVQEIDFTHVPIELCIQRDKERGLRGERSVGPEVILSIASRIRPNDEVKEEKVLVIGDVHGDYRRLLSLLAKVGVTKAYEDSPWLNPQGYKVIFLGDLNDPRLDDDNLNRTEMSSLTSIRIAKELWEEGIGELVQSNHQLNLINLWNGSRKSLTHGLNYTKEEIDKGDRYEVNRLILWLSSRPYYYKFISAGKEYVCVHAYYTPGMSQYHPTGLEINDCLYGPRLDGVRFEWWKKQKEASPFVIAGHYHLVDKGINHLILDGNCGGSGGCLMGYLPDSDTILSM